jgi:hypothetical protein
MTETLLLKDSDRDDDIDDSSSNGDDASATGIDRGYTKEGGWNLKVNFEMIWVEKNELKLKFDIKITTALGILYCMYMHRATEVVNPAVMYSMNKVHKLVRQSHMDATRSTVKILVEYQVSGDGG